MVLDCCGFRSDVVCEASVGFACLSFDLLAQEVERDGFFVGSIGVWRDEDIVSSACCGEESVYGAEFEQVLVDNPIQQGCCIVKEFGRLFAVFGVGEDVGVDAAEFPGVEEWGPVDVLDEFSEFEALGAEGSLGVDRRQL
ncbi:MAG: hypothetical protein RIS92_3193 [Verrucomicrobiota bacterium]